MLYEKDLYLNKDIQYLISNEIIEYDMSNAGFNIIKYFKLLPESTIEYLDKLPKDKRTIRIGILERDDKELAKKMNDGFKKARKMFYEANDLTDDDILSIKKDALFITKRCHNLIFDNIEFKEKNIYTSYYYFNKLEFYVGKSKIDVKGINNNTLKLHQDFMLDFLFKIFKMIETTDRRIVVKNLMEFIDYYKNRLLDVGYYRELNRDSLFRLNHMLSKRNNISIGSHEMDDVTLDKIDISYNYMAYIVPLIQLLQ